MNKTSLTTHESFSLSRVSLSQVLRVAAVRQNEEIKKLSLDSIHQQTSLGTNQVKSTRIYARGANLFNEHDGLTAFGKLVFANDPGLSNKTTQWAIHYSMASPHGYGPSYWGSMTTSLFEPDEKLRPKAVAEKIKQFPLSCTDKQLSEDTYSRAATEFLGTYAKWDGLGDLGILSEPINGEYAVGDPVPVPWRVAAYALADYWQGNWSDRTGVNLERMREVGALLLVGSGEMNGFLRTMQEHGLVDVQRRHPPFQVTRLFSDADAVLAHLYDADEA